jgi:hypothetical protein
MPQDCINFVHYCFDYLFGVIKMLPIKQRTYFRLRSFLVNIGWRKAGVKGTQKLRGGWPNGFIPFNIYWLLA